jgi:aryl-alcohol dehydrogenase-like predicted oxidoreductase
MDTTILGRTGLRSSRMGLGGGGASRLGAGTGRTPAESGALVRRALDLGVTLFDTAESYGTEAILGRALGGVPRDSVVISTKKSAWEEAHLAPAAVTAALEASLTRLGTDHVDVYFLHAVPAELYPKVVDAVLPVLLRLRTEGKLRWIGLTEAFGSDRGHAMLSLAVRDLWWDVFMVGFSILNQSARDRVLAEAIRKNIGILDMFAVRSAFSRPAKLAETLADLVRRGLVDPGLTRESLLDLVRSGGAVDLPDAAYRFCRDEPGVHTVLVGTGDIAHLEANAASLARPMLDPAVTARLRALFARVDDVSGG